MGERAMRLGGNNLTVGDYCRIAHRVLASLPRVSMGWRFQCRCGNCEWAKYRSHFYCPTCARRYLTPDAAPGNSALTFREKYHAALRAERAPNNEEGEGRTDTN